MKILHKICFVLLMTTFPSVYGGSCWDKVSNVDDCLVRAERGNSSAQYNLGVLYDNGRGVRKDYKEAVKWYRKSAEQGHDLAQYYLGEMYYRGQGVRKNKSMAHMYWNIAAVSGYKIAIKERDRIEGVMSDSQIEKAQDLAREWMRKHQ